MGNFDLTVTAGVKEAGKALSAGIHNAKFNGIKFNTIISQNNGNSYNTMQLNLVIENYGDFSHNFFEPTSNERAESQFGPNPSQVEHFMVAVRQILDALDPEIGKKIDTDTVEVKGKHVNIKNLNFNQLIKLLEILTEPYIGTELEVKLIPQSNGFNAIPGFPARITKTGALGIATRFIGHDLVLNQSEQKKIDAANNAKPTNMKQVETGSVEGLAEALGIEPDSTEGDGSDLPF